MTEDELIRFLRRPEAEVFDALADMPKAERRKLGARVLKLNKSADAAWMKGGQRPPMTLPLALMACCTFSQLKTLRYQPFFDDIVDVLRTFEIKFVEDWVNYDIETNPHAVARLQPIWEAGLCPRPTSDAYTMGFYARGRLFDWNGGDVQRLEMDDAFFQTEVWRFFEVEGIGEFSLAAHDQYKHLANYSWQKRLLEYAETGRLDRGRLLDASLDALALDFAQFRAGWYSRFHEALKPTVEERVARSEAYLRLLGSSIQPTVSFAMKALKAINKAAPIAPDVLRAGLEPALQARPKATVTSALQLLGDAAKRAPEQAVEVARAACLALIHEDASVQGKALDLIERLGGLDNADIAAELSPYMPHLAPSLRTRFGKRDAETSDAPVCRKTPEPIIPAATAEDALAAFLEVLEDDRDPFKIERALDGMARFGAELRDTKAALSPLRKRAQQLKKTKWGFLVEAALCWCNGTVKDLKHLAGYYNYDFHLRNADLLEIVAAGLSLPMLSMPTDTGGFIDPAILRGRLVAYRASGFRPGNDDLSVALLRMPLNATVPSGFTAKTDAEHSFVHALGGKADQNRISNVAKEARMLREAHHSDAPLKFELYVESEEDFAYFQQVPRNAFVRKYDALQMHPNSGWLAGTTSDSAWHGLVCPGFPDPYFRNVLLETDSYYGAAAHHFDPFFRPGPKVGPVGASVIALGLGDPHRETRQIAVDAVIALLDEGRLDAALFAEAFNGVFFNFHRPAKRFTESLTALAQSGGRGTEFACAIITGTMIFAPDAAPKDYGSLLELLYELSQSRTDLLTAEQKAFLAALPGGGKVKTFARLLAA